jgi:hypothetical protein
MRQKESAPLKLTQNGLCRLGCWRDSNRFEHSAAFAPEIPGVQEVLFGVRRDASQEQRADVNWAVARCPFKALKTSGDMFGGRSLSAAVANQVVRGHG